VNKKPKTLTSVEIAEAIIAINKAFGTVDCFAKNQLRVNVNPRHAFAFYLHRIRDTSSIYAGRIIGKDHASVLHSVKQHKDFYQTDKEYRDNFDNFLKEMKPIKFKRWLCVESPFNLQIIKK